MGRWTAPSSDDYRDEQEGYRRMVTWICTDCGELFRLPVSDGPPLGRPLCECCKQQIELRQ